MCDFSLKAVKSRPAVVGDKLVVHDFGTGTRGFSSVDEDSRNGPRTAVCVLPGTEIAFDDNIKVNVGACYVRMDGLYAHPNGSNMGHNLARFRQVEKDNPHCHHDALEMPDGKLVMLTHLVAGQTATVLQLPAAPKNDVEAAEQKRAEYIS